jgi:hypothetical protein
MNIHKTIYGEELYKLLSVKDVIKFLEQRNIFISDIGLERYGFKNGLKGLKIEFFDKDELFKILEPTVAYQMETQLVTYMFNTEIIIKF